MGKDVQNRIPLGNCRLKQDTTALLEWVRFKTLAIPNALEFVEHQELSHSLLVAMQKYTHFGRQYG